MAILCKSLQCLTMQVDCTLQLIRPSVTIATHVYVQRAPFEIAHEILLNFL